MIFVAIMIMAIDDLHHIWLLGINGVTDDHIDAGAVTVDNVSLAIVAIVAAASRPSKLGIVTGCFDQNRNDQLPL